jgi:NADH-quinone oxidoreductase subunit A|tara:strand:- start:21352 stop:21747 length:396 start_codon:yes stop_codon:yes gene_type:complete
MIFNYFNISLLKANLYPIFIFLIFSFFLSSLILFLSYSIAIQNPETEKLSSYECGFEPYEDARQNFDIKFYLIAILFLIFDIETIFLIPWSVTFNLLNVLSYWVIIDFILELGIGFIYIWYLNVFFYKTLK